MVGLYVHIPFCHSKCYYCDFVSFIPSEKLIWRYFDALAKEISYYTTNYRLRNISTIYIGGGTPSILSLEQIKFLFNNIYIKFNCSKVTEVTFEANPDSLSEDKLLLLHRLGVTRLSIGLQSFVDSELQILGRKHSVEEFLQCYKIARKIGFRNINFDLMYGIPSQNMSSWKRTLDKAISLSPEHISAYCLTIEPGTSFCQQNVFIDDDLCADMYAYCIDFLPAKGYQQYEISNFAKRGYECNHNKKYWLNCEYIGLGVAASSYINGKRWKNGNNIDEYICSNGKLQKTEEEVLVGKSKLAERIILGLRLLEGVKLTNIEKTIFQEPISVLIREKLVRLQENTLFLTRKGLFLSNYVFQQFI